MADDHLKDFALVQKKHALMENISSIPPFNGEASSVTFSEFFEKFDSLVQFFKWEEEERKFALFSRVSGGAARLYKINKDKTSDEILKIFKERYTHHTSPDVALSNFFSFKQTPHMSVQDFYDRAYDMSLKALMIEGLEAEVVEKNRNAILHSMLLGNLAPEIRKGVITKSPQTPEEILRVALLEEKACRSVSANPFYNLQNEVSTPFTPKCVQQNVACAAVHPKSESKQSQQEINKLREQVELLTAKIESLVQNNERRSEMQSRERNNQQNFSCYICSEIGHFARDCPQARYQNNYGRGRYSNYRGRGGYSNNYRGNPSQPDSNYFRENRGRNDYNYNGRDRQDVNYRGSRGRSGNSNRGRNDYNDRDRSGYNNEGTDNYENKGISNSDQTGNENVNQPSSNSNTQGAPTVPLN